MAEDHPNRLWTLAEVEEARGIPIRLLRRLIYDGRLASVKLGPRTSPIRLRMSDVDALIEASVRPSVVEPEPAIRQRWAKILSEPERFPIRRRGAKR